MSVIASTAEQICNSPTNQSHAKMLYSFPKSPRFPKSKQNQCDQFYDLTKRSQLRGTSLGYGNKYDFTKDLPKTPPPGAYQIFDLFQTSKKTKKGFGFGSGRGQMEVTGIIQKNENPGPGAYEAIGSKSKIFSSIKGKGKVDDRQKRYVPGPGAYQINSTFSKTGINFSSRYKNKSAYKFSQQRKLKIQNRKVPGPGTYETIRTEFSPQGKYPLSRLQSAKNGKFGKQSRLSSQNRCKTPGPGNYRLPSQFGYYVSRNALNQINNTLQL